VFTLGGQGEVPSGACGDGWGGVSAGCRGWGWLAGESSFSGLVPGSGPSTDVFGNGVAGGETSRFDLVDGVAVDVSGLVGVSAGEGGPYPADQFSGCGAGGLDVVVAPFTHHPLIEGGELGVVLAGDVGGLVERQPELWGCCA